MAFYNPYAAGGYYPSPPMPDQLAQYRQNYQMPQTPAQPVQQSAPIIWVQGEEGAKAYMVAAGNSVLLMDSENSVFYIKATDASGMPQPLRIFDYSERAAQAKTPVQTSNTEYVTRAELNAITARLDAMEQKGNENEKSFV